MATRRSPARAFLGCVVMLNLMASCMVTTDTDGTTDQVEAADNLTQPNSVVASGALCGLNYSISHSTGVAVVSQSSLVVVSTSSAVINGTMPGIVAVAHVDSGEVDPTALADNQTPVTSFASQVQQGLASDPPVTSTTTWMNPTQFSNASLCTATASTFIQVTFSVGPKCSIRHTTSFPSCVPVR